MGRDLKGKECGKGICQRKCAKFTRDIMRGTVIVTQTERHGYFNKETVTIGHVWETELNNKMAHLACGCG